MPRAFRFPPIILSIAVIGGLLTALPAAGATRTLTFTPVADTTVKASAPTKSFGTATTLSADSSPVEHALLRFAVTGLGADPVSSASLRLYVTNASPVAGTVFRVASQTWPESVTWSTAPAADATSIAAGGRASKGTWVSFDVTNLISTDGTYSVRITSSSSDGVDYTSREGSVAQRPQLVVNAAVAPDTTPPSPPQGLSAHVDGPTQVTLGWGASLDDVGVASYEVRRGEAPIGSVTNPGFVDTAAPSNTTLTYTVRAVDASGNRSDPASATVTTPEPAADVQPRFPIRAAFYYPWFPETWGNVSDPFTNYHPSLGYYDSSDAAVVQTHVAEMRGARLDAGIASWWGQGTRTDGRIPTLLRGADGTPFRWALYYEQEGSADPTVSEISAALAYIDNRYAHDPNYLRVNGRPVIFVYSDANDGCPMAQRWLDANTLGFYLSLRVFTGYRTCAAQPDAWHQYGPAQASDPQLPDSYTISPGFWKKGEASPRLARDPTRWANQVAAMKTSGARWQLVTTFNEWGEGTAIEPAEEWGSTYLDILGSPPTSFSFAAAGDIGANAVTTATLSKLNASPTAFFLALGDLRYQDVSTDQAWCDYIHARTPTLGASYPFEVLTGAHEQDGSPDGTIQGLAACMPDGVRATPAPGSAYGVDYTFDYPAGAPLARFISISPGLTVGTDPHTFAPGSPGYTWLADTIDGARTAGIPWVIVAMHHPCLSAGASACPSGASLLNLLVQKRVDLILQADDHSYQRSKQLALDPTLCPSIAAAGYARGCVIDDGIDGIYPKGAGSVNVIAGTFGRSLDAVARTDGEAPYFAALDGTSHGYVRYTVSADRLAASFVNSDGTFADTFSILSGATATADRNAPTQPTDLRTDTGVPGRVAVSWTPSVDDVAVANYAVMRNGAFLASTSTTTFTDTSVVAGQSYSYEVIAYDTAFNPSAASGPAVANVAASSTLTFSPDADASIYSASASTNYGPAPTLETDNSPIKNFLIRFTVTGVGTRTVTNATLYLRCTDPSPRGGDFALAASSAWTESTVTWASAPAPGAAVTSLGSVAAGTTYAIDLTSVIRGDGTYTIRVTTPSSDGADYASREATTASRPQLTLMTAS